MNPSEERFGDGESSNLEEELEGDMSTDASTVQLPRSAETGETLTGTDTFKEKEKAEDNLTAMLAYLMDEISKIRLEMRGRKDTSDIIQCTHQLNHVYTVALVLVIVRTCS